MNKLSSPIGKPCQKLNTKVGRIQDTTVRSGKNKFKSERILAANGSDLRINNNYSTTKNKECGCEDCSNSSNDSSIAGSNKSYADAEYVECLLRKIKQLKKRACYFEGKCKLQSYSTNHNIKETGDFIIHNSKKKQHIKQPLIDHHHLIDTKIVNYFQKDTEHQKRNAKNRKLSCASCFASNCSNIRNNLFRVDPKVDPTHFRSIATEFIQQAEELKSKIAYILECSGYSTPSVSNYSIKAPQSESVIPNSSNEDYGCTCENYFGEHLKKLYDTINDQYLEVIKMLTLIRKDIKNLDQKNGINKDSIIETSKMKNDELPVSPSRSAKNKQQNKNTNTLQPNLEKNKNGKKLEPVVLVYEPIQPQNKPAHICKNCGHQSNSCVDICNHKSGKKSISGTKKGNEYKQKHKIGFVLMYTPDFTRNTPPKDYKNENEKAKVKKKNVPCFWF